jgi:hypothetical protein
MGYIEEHSYAEVITGSVEVREPRLVKRETVASANAYKIRLLQLGAMEGAFAEMDINPLLRPLIEAIHHVLAGGEVEIKLVAPGEPQVVQELNGRLEQMINETNAVSLQAGYSLPPGT